MITESTQWPEWSCKNSCGRKFPKDTALVTCPDCKVQLVRWRSYQTKMKERP